MKLFKLTLLLLLISTLSNAQKGTLVIKVMGVKQLSGSIAVALYSNPDTFLKESFVDGFQKIDDQNVAVTVRDIPPGTYAISLFQDVNNNGKIDRNFIGIPKEPFAFGNNAMGMFGPPEFYAASVEIQTDRTTRMVIVLNHM